MGGQLIDFVVDVIIGIHDDEHSITNFIFKKDIILNLGILLTVCNLYPICMFGQYIQLEKLKLLNLK